MIFGATQENIAIREIERGMIILSPGEYRSVLEANPINFSFKDELEKESLVMRYESFLNSLTFDIQIVIISRKLDMDRYLSNLQRYALTEKNPVLKEQVQNHILFLSQLVKERNLLQKKIYIVVPYRDYEGIGVTSSKASLGLKKTLSRIFPSVNGNRHWDEEEQKRVWEKREERLEKARAQLNQRISAVSNRLMGMGIGVRELDTYEIIELLYYLYNPHKADVQKLRKEIFDRQSSLAVMLREEE